MVLVLICLAVLLPATLTAGDMGPLSFEFHVEDVQPGCSEDGVAYPVTITIRATVTNLSDRALIFSRGFGSGAYYYVAASPDEGALGIHEFESRQLEIKAGDEPEPTFGAEPDGERFIVLPPRSSYETDVQTGIVAGNRDAVEGLPPGHGAGLVLPGAYAIQVSIRTWPHIFLEPGVVTRLRREWAHVGTLVTTSVQTPFLEFELPDTMLTCDER